MHRLGAIILKEFNQIKRDKRTLLILIFFPAFLLLIFGYAVDFDVKNLELGVLNLDGSKESRAFIEKFSLYEHFDLKYQLKKYNEIDYYLDSEKIRACLVIPEDFTEKLNKGENVSVQVIIDGTNSNTGMTALGNLSAYIKDYSDQLTIAAFKKIGVEKTPIPVELIPRVWYNQDLKSIKFMIPGLIGFIMMIVCVIATALSIVREKERFTMEQIIVSPIKPYELIIGKTLPYLIISLVTMILIIIMGIILFGVTIKGSLIYLFITSLIFIIGALGLGMLISSLTDSQQAAYMISVILTFLPAMILSGFVFPISSMPKVIQFITYFVQLRYYLIILRSIILKGTGLISFGDQLLYLSLYSLILIVISSVRLRKSL